MSQAIHRLEQSRAADNIDKGKDTQEKVNRAIERHQAHTEESYQQALLEVEKNKAARETQGLGQLLGTIFLGPIIGTLIGGAIAGWANDGDEADAREAKKRTSLEDLQVDKAYDDLDTAKKDFEELRADNKDVQKFSSELRETDWVNTTI